jgi:hypothetical protein
MQHPPWFHLFVFPCSALVSELAITMSLKYITLSPEGDTLTVITNAR